MPFICLLGIFYYHIYFIFRAGTIDIPFETRTRFAGIVADEPRHSANSEYFSLHLAPPHKGKIRIVASPDSGFLYGDFLDIRGVVRMPELDRTAPVAIFPNIEIIARGRGSAVRQFLSDFKLRLLSIFSGYLPAEESAFLGGILLGARASFSPEFRSALAASGTTHLIALSGYNIAILIFVVFGACLRCIGRRASFYLTVLSMVIFVVMVGGEPSIVRAAMMAFVMLLARELGQPYGLPYALLWTALAMVLFDPAVLFMPGFQLSFTSLLGIVYLSPVLLKWLGVVPGADSFSPGGFRENAALTTSAQLAVAPIAIAHFGSVSLTSFLANALILPFIPISMFLGFLLLLCGFIFPPLGFMVSLASHMLLSYEIGVIRFFSGIPLPFTASAGALGVSLYYLFLIILIRKHAIDEKAKN